MDEDSFAELTALSEHATHWHIPDTLKIFPKLLSVDLLVKDDYERK